MKTAEELYITQEEYDALLWVREKLASGKIEHSSHVRAHDGGVHNMFNMSVASAPYSCGTVACIGGWMSLKMQDVADAAIEDNLKLRWITTAHANNYVGSYAGDNEHREANGRDGRSQLGRLFYPKETLAWDPITPAQAVRAIDNYLETGQPRWEEIVAAV